MGGIGSSRWHGYEKAPLIEEAICVDLVTLRRAGFFDGPGLPYSITWNRGSSNSPAAEGLMSLEIGQGGTRWLVAVIALFGKRKPLSARLQLEPFHPHFGGLRWFVRCPTPGCDRRVLKLYVAPSGSSLGCRQCVGVTYRSCQDHDSRLDQARRDPEGFAEARQAAPKTANSAFVTLGIWENALEETKVPHRGRSWGRDSMTTVKRLLAAGEVG
jgi:hypothetical protein